MLNLFFLTKCTIVYLILNLFNFLSVFNFLFYTEFIFNFISVDMFSASMLVYNIIISAYCLILFYTKVNKNNNFVIINIMALNAALVFLFFIDNIYYFFIFYELTMIPSILLIKFSSPNLRSKVVSIYFILWTQFGSFLVFLSILLLFKINYNFYNYNNQSPSIYNTVIFILFFFGFGIKIPI